MLQLNIFHNIKSWGKKPILAHLIFPTLFQVTIGYTERAGVLDDCWLRLRPGVQPKLIFYPWCISQVSESSKEKGHIDFTGITILQKAKNIKPAIERNNISAQYQIDEKVYFENVPLPLIQVGLLEQLI